MVSHWPRLPPPPELHQHRHVRCAPSPCPVELLPGDCRLAASTPTGGGIPKELGGGSLATLNWGAALRARARCLDTSLRTADLT